MARGYKGWFGRKLNDTRLWLAFCAVFLVALVDWRRIWTLRTLDLVALLSFSVSLWYFERGLVFWAVPLQYPPMVYLIARLDLDRFARTTARREHGPPAAPGRWRRSPCS